VGIAQVLHFALERQVERLLRRFVETNTTENVPVATLVSPVLLVSGKEKVVEGDSTRQWKKKKGDRLLFR